MPNKPVAYFNPEHTLFNEIRTSAPVNDEGEPLHYLVSEQQLQRIRQLEFTAAQHQGEPIYQIMYRGDGGGGWCDAEKDSYDMKVPHPKHWQTRIVYAEQSAPDYEKAARRLAHCMEYPWQHMPEQGRQSMREHAKSIVESALGVDHE